MPTTDIIGYLWSNRQELEIADIPDLLRVVADLQDAGLECVRVSDFRVLGVATGSTVQWVQLEDANWADLVHTAILSSAVENTVNMLHSEDGDGA